MKCIFCGFDDLAVVDSRHIDDKRIKRRRECSNCHKRFTTYEFVEKPILMVKKKDGAFEPFDRNKLSRGIFSAIKKRPTATRKVEEIVEYIENSCENDMRTQITSTEIGDIVMEKLKDIDEVAYVRFASVYKAFNDVDGFIDIISTLSKKD
ncbi:MAG: transcriptional regulator NrdR [Ruminococcus sp.]|nr:transcriptional regulator NrdR [Ruminococcus sp.]MCD7800528.1 transcriptional regulator NrdR [Ruminococcus sp.]